MSATFGGAFSQFSFENPVDTVPPMVEWPDVFVNRYNAVKRRAHRLKSGRILAYLDFEVDVPPSWALWNRHGCERMKLDWNYWN